MWSIRTKKKLKEQNSSRITEPKNGLTVTKGKGSGEYWWEGSGKVGKNAGSMISMYNWWGHEEGCATHRRQVVILQHLTTLMDSDRNGVFGGNLIIGGNVLTTMLLL